MRRATVVLVLLALAAPALARRPYPGADAVILEWHRRFTLSEDGTVTRRVRRTVEIRHPRAIRAFADPRIDYEEGRETVRVIVARTVRPDGTIVEVPDYSYNTAAPHDVAGYPAWAAWRQRIVSFSAIEPGAVLELEYEIVSKPGVFPWLEVDEPLDTVHPVLSSRVVVEVPGREPETWEASDLPAIVVEPQSPPLWYRSRRARLSTCPGGLEAWVRSFRDAILSAAEPDDAIRTLAREAAGDATDDEDRIERVVRKLKDAMRLVDSPKTWRSRTCRPAAEVFRSGYASPLEAAALALAALRSVGIGAEPGVSLRDRTVPDVDNVVVGFRLLVGGDEDRRVLDPREGIVRTVEEERHVLESGTKRTYLTPRGAGITSEIAVTGRLSIDGKGRPSGTLEIRLSGLFLDPHALRTADAQRKRLAAILGRLASGLELTGHVLTAFTDDALEATVEVGGGPLPEAAGGRLLRLGDGPTFLADVPLPLARSERRTPVRTRGAVRESVDVTISGAGSFAVVPAGIEPQDGSWGHARQTVAREKGAVHLRREVETTRATLTPLMFHELRRVVNAMRAEGARLLLLVR